MAGQPACDTAVPSGSSAMPLHFLGQAVAFTISDTSVNLEQMRVDLGSRGLRADLLKKRLRPIDAFKKASNEVAVNFPSAGDHRSAIKVVAVGQNDAEAHRHVVLARTTWRVGRERRVDHETIFKLTYDRGVSSKDGTVSDDYVSVEQQVVPGLLLTEQERQWITTTLGDDGDALRARFQHHCTHLDSHGIRTFVREYLDALDAIDVKDSGGLYFVPQVHAVELQALAEFVRSLGSTMHLFPLLDGTDQRSMLEHAFVGHVRDAIRTYLSEADRIVANPQRTIAEGTYQSFADRVEKLASKRDRYKQLLDCDLETASELLTKLDLTTSQLRGRVRRPKSLRKR